MNFGGFDGPRAPMSHASNYAYWKMRMKSALKAINEQVWQTVLNVNPHLEP